MSWQTHLGLVLGDNLVDSDEQKKALLATFAHGLRHANPKNVRGGNQLYHTAFLYHFGDFAAARAELAAILRRNPNAIRYFLSTRPGFIYMNRQRLYDDLLELSAPSQRKQLGIDHVIRPYNDGSRDSSFDVMLKAAARHPHIEVRNKPNGGHGNTILTGYRDAASDGFSWIFQIDSDDEMGPESFHELWTDLRAQRHSIRPCCSQQPSPLRTSRPAARPHYRRSIDQKMETA